MKKERTIGRSNLKTPYIGMGTWAIGGGTWWGENDDAISIRTIEEAIDREIVWFDTAPVYGIGHSEEIVGKALKRNRSKVLLSTKCGLEWEHQTPCFHKVMEGRNVYRNLSASSIRKNLEDSLRRLQTDYIDIYYTHWQTPDFSLYPLEETMDTLLQLKKEGKIRAIGASNVTAEIIEKYCSLGQLDVIQEKYSLLDTHIAEDLLPVCQKHHISIQAYSPLEQGLLTGKVTTGTVLSPTDVRNKNRFWKPESRILILDVLKKLTPYTEKYHCSLSNLIIYLTAASLPDLHVLCGARKPEQIIDNAQTLSLNLDEKDVFDMNTLFTQLRNFVK